MANHSVDHYISMFYQPLAGSITRQGFVHKLLVSCWRILDYICTMLHK